MKVNKASLLAELIKYNMALDFKNTTFLRPTFSPINRLNTFYRKINTALFLKIKYDNPKIMTTEWGILNFGLAKGECH